jgi:hypothetical protein
MADDLEEKTIELSDTDEEYKSVDVTEDLEKHLGLK